MRRSMKAILREPVFTKLMRANLYHRIISHPQPEDVGTVTITAMVEGYDWMLTTTSSVQGFIDKRNYKCQSKRHLYDFLSGSGVDAHDCLYGLKEAIFYASNVTTEESDYFPGCALKVSLFLLRPRPNCRTLSANNFVVRSLPRKMYEKVISSTDDEHDKECTICLDKFNNESRVVTLPCEHFFHDHCAVTWLETGHDCPVCRFKLPCQLQP